jgi:hypothetical protein
MMPAATKPINPAPTAMAVHGGFSLGNANRVTDASMAVLTASGMATG